MPSSVAYSVDVKRQAPAKLTVLNAFIKSGSKLDLVYKATYGVILQKGPLTRKTNHTISVCNVPDRMFRFCGFAVIPCHGVFGCHFGKISI